MNKKFLLGFSIVVVLGIIMLFSARRRPQIEANTSWSRVQEWRTQAEQFKKDRDLTKAREIYQKILSEHSDYNDIETIQKDLEDINFSLIVSNSIVPEKTIVHEVNSGDTLGKIAQQYGATVDLIKKSNHLESDVIRVGKKLRIWKGNFNLYIDKSQNTLILKDGKELVKVYRVSTGENNSTPVGRFKIVNKLIDPVWFNKGIVVPTESPANVLGSRWMGFDLPGYGIHGTIEPQTIGQQVTAGCVRMNNKEVEELYTIIPMGTEVTIVD